jgi:hypothetical protein
MGKETPKMRGTVDSWTTGRLNLLRVALPVFLASLCAGCGLAGTAVATGAGAAAEVQEAQQAKQTEARVQRELDEAQRAAAQQRNDAEAQGK